MMSDVLCIGATGMLAGCVRALIARGDRIDCIARTLVGLEELKQTISTSDRTRLCTHSCDYRDLEQFEETLSSLSFQPSAAICWVHSPAEQVLDRIRHRFPDIDLLQVVGSSTRLAGGSGTPANRIVRLGSESAGDQSRWLTHDEIARGVYDAFVSGENLSQVGIIKP